MCDSNVDTEMHASSSQYGSSAGQFSQQYALCTLAASQVRLLLLVLLVMMAALDSMIEGIASSAKRSLLLMPEPE
jgi:hypothetical protein